MTPKRLFSALFVVLMVNSCLLIYVAPQASALATESFPDTGDWNSLNITYAITGADLGLPNDSSYKLPSGFETHLQRAFTGSFSGTSLTVEGTFNVFGMPPYLNWGISAYASVGVDGTFDTKSFSWQNTGSSVADWHQSFSLSVPIPTNASIGSFDIKLQRPYQPEPGAPAISLLLEIKGNITVSGSLCISGDVLEEGLSSIPPDTHSYVKAFNIQTNATYLSRGKNDPDLPWDENGEYIIICPAGVYRMWAWSPCYIPNVKERVEHALTEAKNTTAINFRLAPSFAQINFKVIDGDGTPVQGAKVSLTEIPHGYNLFSTTNSTGQTWLLLEGTIAPSAANYTLDITQGAQTVRTQMFVAIPLCHNMTDPGQYLLWQTTPIKWGSTEPLEPPRVDVILDGSNTILGDTVTPSPLNPSGDINYSSLIIIAVVAIAIVLVVLFVVRSRKSSVPLPPPPPPPQ